MTCNKIAKKIEYSELLLVQGNDIANTFRTAKNYASLDNNDVKLINFNYEIVWIERTTS